jgi:hypothetical protein
VFHRTSQTVVTTSTVATATAIGMYNLRSLGHLREKKLRNFSRAELPD